MIGFLAFALPLTLYFSLPSTLWNFDGVACAAALELGQPAYFFHANHLVYGFLGFLFWRFVGLPLGLSRSLPALALFTSLLAAAGLVGLYRLFTFVLKNELLALTLTLSMATTAAFWVWSIEAQVYSLGFLALAWATYVLVVRPGPRPYVWVGLLHGGAILGHLMHALWMVPALYWIRHERPFPRQAIRHYLVSLGTVTLSFYFLVIAWAIAPGRDLRHIFIWLMGSAALTPDRSWAWHSVGWGGPWEWFKSTLPALWGSYWPYGRTVIAPWIWPTAAISMIIFAFLLFRGSRDTVDGQSTASMMLARFSWIWLGTYGLFLSTWEPATLCYRMVDVIPLGLLLAIGLKSQRASIQILLTVLLLGTTTGVNLATRIAPMHRPEENAVYQETLILSRITSAKSLYITAGGLPWLYILYFAGRTAWNARTLNATQLMDELPRQKRMRPVYIQSPLVGDRALGQILRSQKLRPLEQGLAWLEVL